VYSEGDVEVVHRTNKCGSCYVGKKTAVSTSAAWHQLYKHRACYKVKQVTHTADNVAQLRSAVVP
jgi:hypothetical protein